MPTTNIPEADVAWLYGLDKKYRVPVADGARYVYSVDILPTSLRSFVKSQNRYIDYINLGPSMGVDNGMMWSVWGWESIPKDSVVDSATWRDSIIAIKGVPTCQVCAQIRADVSKLKADLDVLLAT